MGQSSAQTIGDALRFTSVQNTGTARYMSMGSSFGALGGDFSSLAQNPAGIGIYRSGQFTISPGLELLNTEATQYGERREEDNANFAMFNLGLINANELENGGRWKFANFGVGYQRSRPFHNEMLYSGVQDVSSLSRFLATGANGLFPEDFQDVDPFYLFPAWESFIFDPDTSTAIGDDYIGAVPDGKEVRQSTRIRTEGRIAETLIGGGVNYDDRLYLGISIGFQRFVYEEFLAYTEEVLTPDENGISSFGYQQDTEILGDGINVRLGAIYRLNDIVRIGAAYTSPTWTQLETNWSTSFSSSFSDGDGYFEPSPAIGYNRFNLRSPSRLLGSLGFVFGKRGLLNVDYEFVDYGRMKFDSSNDTPIDFTADNAEIQRVHNSVGILRIGGELRHKWLSLRAGYAYLPSPYVDGVLDYQKDQEMISGGLGFRMKNTSLDIAYRTNRFSGEQFAFQDGLQEPARLDFVNNAVVMTLGVRF